MRLTKCNDCERKISPDADICPHCHCDLVAVRQAWASKVDRELLKEGFTTDAAGSKAYKEKFGSYPRQKMYVDEMKRMYPDVMKHYDESEEKLNRDAKEWAERQKEEKRKGEEEVRSINEWYKNDTALILLLIFCFPAALYGLYKRWFEK